MTEQRIEACRESNITCPYYRQTNEDSWESGLENDGDSMECYCDECNKKFYVNLNITVTYNSLGLCKENNVEHNWKYFDYITNGKRCYGRKCLTCDKYEFNVEGKGDKE